MRKKIPFAIVYDFDGTLAPGNMQERDFFPAIGMKSKKFWNDVKSLEKEKKADNILMYMKLMLDQARSKKVHVKKEDFVEFGRQIQFFEGILSDPESEGLKGGWFDRINAYGKESGLNIEHYIVSSGIREMIEGTPISSKFKAIFASSFCYDHYGIAEWPALALNYTSKTQYLFRINKKCLEVDEHKGINEYVPDEKRAIPFRHMIYIGDGETDIPCFRVVKDRGGHSIAVYRPCTKGAKEKCENLIRDGRVNFTAPADYRDGKKIDQLVKALIDKVEQENHLRRLST